MDFFKDNYLKFELKQDTLRKCQLGAYWATLSHFTKSNEPALISLPTGSGKTELMQILSFGFQVRRVLIIVPSQLLKGELVRRFKDLKRLREIGVLDSEIQNPKVRSLGSKRQSALDWEALKDFDVVVATPNTVSTYFKSVFAPPSDLFDLVLIDEAHHIEAPSWNQIVNDFEASKRIFLTATPFREDNKIIQAKLIYYYPIKKAIEEKIYQKIEFISSDSSSHMSLALKTSLLIKDLEEQNVQGKVLVRSQFIKDAPEIIEAYREVGLTLEEVNYQKSKEHNNDSIEKLKKGEIDGIVSVGMVGEGMDIPNLNILVFHSIPKSFPLTIQYIGRISRTSESNNTSYLIAEKESFSTRFKKVHQNDSDWDSLIENIQDAIDLKLSSVYESNFFNKKLYRSLLNPYYNVTIYNSENVNFDINTNNLNEFKDVESYFQVEYFQYEEESNLLVVVTMHDDNPIWASLTPLKEKRYNLHVYYYSSDENLLFEHTTSPNISKKILGEIVPNMNDLKLLSPQRLYNVINKKDLDGYLTLGMRNSLGFGKLNPSYKSHIGNAIQNSIRPSDKGFFSAGHVLAKNKEDYIGFSAHKSKVWSMSRGSIDGFIAWCKNRVVDINKGANVNLPLVNHLLSPVTVKKISKWPLAMVLNEDVIVNYFSFVINNDEYEIKYPFFNIEDFDEDQGKIIVSIKIKNEIYIEGLSYSIKNGWEYNGDGGIKIRYGLRGNELTLLEYLRRYPTKLFFNDGLLINDTFYKINEKRDLTSLDELYKEINWTECDTRYETRSTKNEEKLEGSPIHEWMINYLSQILSPEALIVQDDGSGEIADLLSVDIEKKEIALYHCKGRVAKAEIPGGRLKDFYEVTGQAVRSTYWIYNKNLIQEIIDRIPRRKGTEIKSGNQSVL
ncbi:DEAD/DEAH box helicase family protein, partial [Rossellomorea vietnamensis]|uniref:DEAD/DEAH box helicase n=1 Tax=Rossellomorea vietnamensis TaxID=218284 RepID=UPI001CCC4F88